jgi:hypothetical protein
VCHVLQYPAFFHFLTRIDEEFAAVTRLGRCPGCAGPLHVADYPRKPRGCPAAVREDYSWRLSFTCGRCDGRATSPSVRFAGRRVYLAVVLMLSSPPGSSSGQVSRSSISVASLARPAGVDSPLLGTRRGACPSVRSRCIASALRKRRDCLRLNPE